MMKNQKNSISGILFLLLVASVGCRTTAPNTSSTLDASGSCQQEVSSTSCSFYPCLESEHQCGQKGYAVGYGNRYCNKFQSLCNGALTSVRAKKWVSGATKCLQQELADLMASTNFKTATCDDIHATGFGSHTYCYTSGSVKHGGASFCTLSSLEWNRVRHCISAGDIFSKEGLKQVLATGARCTPLLGNLFNLDQGDLEQMDVDPETIQFINNLSPEERAARAAALAKFLEEIQESIDQREPSSE